MCYSPPLLAGFRCRWWWAVPATPGWGPLAALVCGVWRVAVVCWWGCGWCVVWLVPRHSWRRFLCATPRHSWLGFAATGGGRSPPLLAGVRWRRRCVVCGVWCVVCGGWCACVFVWVLCLARSGGPASPARSGAPHFFFWPLCLSALLGPLRAGVAPLSLAAVAVPRCPGAVSWFFLFFFGPSAAWLSVRSRLVCVSRLAVGCSLVVAPPPPSPLVSRGFRRSCLVPWCFLFFFLPLLLPLCAPVVSGLLWFPAPGALGLGACVVCLVGLPPLGSPCACPCFVLSAWLLGAPWWLLPPPTPPPFVSRGFRRCRPVLCAVLCCASLGAVLCPAAAHCVARCCAVVCCVALFWCRCLLRRALWRCLSPSGPVLCGAVFCGVPPRCVLCAVCVLSWRGGACCCSPLCFVLCVSRGAVLCVPCALCSVRCCAWLCWCARVVLFVWCVLLLAPGAVVRCCVLSCFLWCAVVRCRVWWPVVGCWWRVSVSVSLSGRVVCFSVVGVVCCGAPLSCVVFCGAVLSRGAVLLCSAVVLRCCWGLLCPPVGCRAVLCCAVGWLCCFLPGGGVCVPWCSFPRAVRSLSSPLCALRCLVVLAVVPCFPVSRALALCCRVVLCCRALLSFCGAFVFALPSCGLSCGASVVCAVVGASCCGVSLCVVVSPWAFCGVVLLLWCALVSCCAVRCPVVSCALCRVLRCRAALRCCAGWLCCAVVCAAGVCFSFCPLFPC